MALSGTLTSKGGSAAPNAALIALLAALFLMAAGVGAAAVLGLKRLPYLATTQEDVEASIEAFAAENPGAGAMFAALKEKYPSVYKSLTARAAKALRRGDLPGAEAAAVETTKTLSRSKAAFLAHASPSRLYDWGRSALALMNASKANAPRLCAQVAFGAVDPRSAPPSLANAAGRHAAATITAFHEGESAPRDYAAPTAADRAAYARAVTAQGLSRTETDLLGRIDAMRALPDRERCALGIKLMRGVIATPEPARSRILSVMATDAAKRL